MAYHTCLVTLASTSPYSSSRHYEADSLHEGESKGAFERRTWRERLHYDPDSKQVYIPPMAFKKTLDGAAKLLKMRVPGEARGEWGKHFLSGIMVMDPLFLSAKRDEVPGEWLFVPSDGRSGGGSRVSKCFPLIARWGGDVLFHILNEKITEEVFLKHLRAAGKLVGVGRFRPEKAGFYGRFHVEAHIWQEARE